MIPTKNNSIFFFVKALSDVMHFVNGLCHDQSRGGKKGPYKRRKVNKKITKINNRHIRKIV